MRKIVISALFALTLIIAGCAPQNKTPKYVFLFIGDGMGVNQVYASELYLGANAGNKGGEKLLMNTFPVSSNMTTYSANSYITCSSAAGTALSSGMKTNNGVVNKSPDLTVNFETISVKAKKAGYKIGVLSSVSIDHATPASFYAHQDKRSMYYEISMELPNYDIDYFGGGGFHYPTGRDEKQANAFDNAVAKGYNYVNTTAAFDSLKNGDEKVLAVNPVVYPKGEFYWEIDKKEGSISLAEFTKKGIEVLDNEKGFFMMVEGGKIDWACHASDAGTMIHEVLAFDDAIKEAFEFYKQHPDETLIIVTADHETGSMFTGFDYTVTPKLLQYQKVSLQEFARKLDTYRKENPKASFNDVMKIVDADFGLGNSEKGMELSDSERKYLYEGYENEFVKNITQDPDADYLEKENVVLLAERVVSVFNTKAGIGWGTSDHSAMPVPVRVLGAGQDNFTEYMDNTDMPKIIGNLLGLPE